MATSKHLGLRTPLRTAEALVPVVAASKIASRDLRVLQRGRVTPVAPVGCCGLVVSVKDCKQQPAPAPRWQMQSFIRGRLAPT